MPRAVIQQDRHQDQEQQESRETNHDLHQAHHQQVGFAAFVTGDQPDEGAQQHRDPRGQKTYRQRHARTENHPCKDIASRMVGAEPMFAGRRHIGHGDRFIRTIRHWRENGEIAVFHLRAERPPRRAVHIIAFGQKRDQQEHRSRDRRDPEDFFTVAENQPEQEQCRQQEQQPVESLADKDFRAVRGEQFGQCGTFQDAVHPDQEREMAGEQRGA